MSKDQIPEHVLKMRIPKGLTKEQEAALVISILHQYAPSRSDKVDVIARLATEEAAKAAQAGKTEEVARLEDIAGTAKLAKLAIKLENPTLKAQWDDVFAALDYNDPHPKPDATHEVKTMGDSSDVTAQVHEGDVSDT